MLNDKSLIAEWNKSKRRQIERFHENSKFFQENFEFLRCDSLSPYIDGMWEDHNRRLEREFLPHPPVDFLKHPSLLYTMFVSERFLGVELPFVQRHCKPETLAKVLEEDLVGDPPLSVRADLPYVTSSNTVHHFYHLLRFQKTTGQDASQYETIVEWGGGYGNLAKVLRRLGPANQTYVMIDTPLFTNLQWLYLNSVFDNPSVHLLTPQNKELAQGRVNLVPVHLADKISVAADLFISTWALNESSSLCQKMVVERNWYGAPHLLMGMHHGVDLESIAVEHGATSEVIGDHQPGQRYVFR